MNKKLKKWIGITAVVLVVLLSAGIGYAAHLYQKTASVMGDSHESVGRVDEKSELRDEVVNPVEDNVSVLIIGVDTSENRDYGEASRSDALMLATFNKKRNSVKLLSIPRDAYVYVPEVGYSTKINHAHFFGGPKATIDTVEQFLNVPVDYYVRVNFEAFMEVVDSLGGIEYEVPYEMTEMDSQDRQNAIHLMPGLQELNGEEALAVARTRKYDSDMERGKRQQKIIKSVADKAASASSILKLDNVIEAVGSNMRTNLTFDDMKSFLSYGLSKNIAIQTVNLEGEGGRMDDGLWYFHVDEESVAAAQDELREQLDLPVEKREATNDFAGDSSLDGDQMH